MARDRTARSRIRTLLVTQGPVEDPSGHATGVLKEAIGYQGSAVAFIQLVAAMDRDGEIVREIRGKRTYRVSAAPDLERIVGFPLAPVPPAGPRPETSAPDRRAGSSTTGGEVIELDYDKLARALVRELVSFISTPPVHAGAGVTDELRAERDLMVAERDAYARQLQRASAKLDDLLGSTDRAGADVRA